MESRPSRALVEVVDIVGLTDRVLPHSLLDRTPDDCAPLVPECCSSTSSSRPGGTSSSPCSASARMSGGDLTASSRYLAGGGLVLAVGSCVLGCRATPCGLFPRLVPLSCAVVNAHSPATQM
eukprot:1042981-Amphidinium_carterae.1